MIRMPRILCLLLLLGFPHQVLAGESRKAPSTRHGTTLALHFIKKGWYDDARLELESALEAPGGQRNPEIHWLLAQVCLELTDVRAALYHSSMSLRLAENVEQASTARELYGYLEGNFGFVRVSGPQPGASTRLQLEPESPMLDPELKRFLDRKALSLRERTALPTELALPAGDYLLNGQPVTVRPSTTTEIPLTWRQMGNKGLSALQVTRLELSSGFGILLGSRVGNLLPGGEFSLALLQPLHRAVLGVTLDQSLRTFSVLDSGEAFDAHAYSVGLGLSFEIFTDGPFVVRPGLGYRYGLLPGIRYDCWSSRDTGSDLVCDTPGNATEASTHLYAVARTHIPYAELTMDYRKAGRTTAAGFGIRFTLDQILGTLPSSTTAKDPNHQDDGLLAVSTERAWFHATGIRILANFSFAL